MNECRQKITNAMAKAIDDYDEAYDRACEKAAEALQKLGPAVEKAAESCRRAFEAAAKAFPEWSDEYGKWIYTPPGEEILTREEAFSGIHKRKKKGKTIRR